MRFQKIIPRETLQPFVKFLALSESDREEPYKVLASTSLVLGFQYRGRLSVVHNDLQDSLAPSGITGISDSFRVFKNTGSTGTVLVYFTETGLSHFSSCPANEIFNQSVSLDNIFDKGRISETEGRLALARNDAHRIQLVEAFLLRHLKSTRQDKLVMEAVRLIYQSRGTIKIEELHQKLFTSQSPLEKRFRALVGATPKKFASIVRFNAVLKDFSTMKSLSQICFENNFFDQSHFIREFKKHTGDTPENFRRFL